jgi:hypothetical protein
MDEQLDDGALLVRAELDRLTGTAPPLGFTGADVVAAGRRRRRARLAMATTAGGMTTAVAVAAAILMPAALIGPGGNPGPEPASVAAPGRSDAPPVATAPDRFDPLQLRVRIGWVPDTLLDVGWDLSTTSQRFFGSEASTEPGGLAVEVLAHGQRFGDHDHGVGLPEPSDAASASVSPDQASRAPSSGLPQDPSKPQEVPAAPVRGRPAVCISYTGGCSALRWEYLPGAVARVSYAGRAGATPAAAAALVRRVAESVTLTAGEPVRLPFQVDLAAVGLRPALTSFYFRKTGPSSYGKPWSASLDLSATLPANRYDFHGVAVNMLSEPGPIYKDGPVNTRVDGHPASRGHNGNESLAVFNVRGSRLLIDVTTPGKDALALYRAVHPVQHPANPADWTDHPTG